MNCHGGIDVTDDGRGELVLLAIDVRNTHTVVGLISGSGDHGKVVHQWRIRTETEVTSDELALTIDDAALRAQFETSALDSLPKEKPLPARAAANAVR